MEKKEGWHAGRHNTEAFAGWAATIMYVTALITDTVWCRLISVCQKYSSDNDELDRLLNNIQLNEPGSRLGWW